MESRYIFVKASEYEKYRIESGPQNLIRRFWLKILGEMPKHIKDEVRMKPTDLKKQSKGEFKITGAIPFQFETKNPSVELKGFLDTFVVFVEQDSEEVVKWREDLKALMKSRDFAVVN